MQFKSFDILLSRYIKEICALCYLFSFPIIFLRKIKLSSVQIGVHHAGKFYEFVPWTGTVTWDIAPWGYWKLTGETGTHLVFNTNHLFLCYILSLLLVSLDMYKYQITYIVFPYQVEIEATTKETGTPLRAPTIEAGLVTACKDTCYGDLRLQLWEKKYDGSKGQVIKALFYIFFR